MAMGSLCEAETQIYLAFDLKYIESDDLSESEKYMTDQKRLIRGMIKKLKKDSGYNTVLDINNLSKHFSTFSLIRQQKVEMSNIEMSKNLNL